MARQRRNEPERKPRTQSRRNPGRGRRMESEYGRGPGHRMVDRRAPEVRKRVLTLSNLLTAFIGFLFVLSLSVTLVLNLRSIYYFDIKYQQLEQKTGLSEEAIRENYDTLIDYNLITKHVKKLEFPDFPMSEHGEIHFAEVKRIFTVVQCLCLISGVILLVLLVKKLRRRDYGSLKLMSIFTFVIPIALGVMACFNWDGFFGKFHALLFKNNYWIFDPATDPVINILPEEFFFHCAIVIVLFLLVGCILTGALYRLVTRKYRRQQMY